MHTINLDFTRNPAPFHNNLTYYLHLTIPSTGPFHATTGLVTHNPDRYPCIAKTRNAGILTTGFVQPGFQADIVPSPWSDHQESYPETHV